MSTQAFQGPLFIVGISRSGTKLLRDLLNNHSRIALPEAESKCIPLFHKRFGQWDEETFKEGFDLFFKQFRETLFYEEIARRGRDIDKEQWRKRVQTWTFGGVIEILFKMAALDEWPENTIWGDKTPNYLLYIPLLKSIFPTAKFIHIIRDVRDVGLSAKKAWNRNIYLTAQRWFDYINRCRSDASAHAPGDYMDVSYEALLADPAVVLEQCCAFLGAGYEEGMTILERPSEEVGDARGETRILSANTGKWKTRLSARQIRKIEAICFPLLLDRGYQLRDTPPVKEPVRLNRVSQFMYRLWEALSFLRAGAGEGGVKAVFKKLLSKIKFRLS